MRYAIKISNAGRRYDGEYDAGNTLDEARKEGQQFASYVKVERPDSRIRIVKFLKDEKSPEGVRVKTVEEVTLSSRDAERRRHRQKATSRKRDLPMKKRPARAWELWTIGDRYDEPAFIVAFKDKGEAQRRMRRLKRSHPSVRYTIKHTQRVSKRRLFGRDPKRGPRGGAYMSPAKRKKVSAKIRLLREEGYPPRQVYAIAYRMYKVARPRSLKTKHLSAAEKRQSTRARRRRR